MGRGVSQPVGVQAKLSHHFSDHKAEKMGREGEIGPGETLLESTEEGEGDAAPLFPVMGRG